MHILRVANFVSPTSGGIKTALRHWGELYQEAGHRASLIIPGPGQEITEESQGLVYRVPATPVPGTGYSLMWSRVGLSRLMDAIAPDVIEVSDRSTTRWMGRWARRRGIGSVMISHENMTGILVRRTPVPERPSHWAADLINRLSAADYDAIVCPSAFAAQEFHRNGLPADVVPLGVDLETFVPTRDLADGPAPGADGPLRIAHCSRLSPEKNPALSIETVRELVRRGRDVELTVFGSGPMLEDLVRRAQNLPVTFHSYVTDRHELAVELGRADWPSPPARWRPSGWRRWSCWPAAYRSSAATREPCRRWSVTAVWCAPRPRPPSPTAWRSCSTGARPGPGRVPPPRGSAGR